MLIIESGVGLFVPSTDDGKTDGCFDPVLNNSARAYPVPVKEILQIELPGLKSWETSDVQLTDMFGKTIERKVITGVHGSIQVQSLASGVYILSVSNLLYRQNIKIIKE